MTILALETSCDETAAAIVQNGITLITQSIATSMPLHAATGGIVPEIASRQQSLFILPVLQEVLSPQFTIDSSQPRGSANQNPRHQPSIPIRPSTINPQPVTAIAVTIGPGLIGSLLVGVETAKTLAYTWNLPLIPVNHMLGHIYGAWLTFGRDMDQHWPKLALLVSGGHTELILMHSHHELQKVGQTLDDAAGEAFDKAAKILGLGYPGGPNLSRLAESGNPTAIPFPLPLNQKNNLNFSFSGLKTALLNYSREHPQTNKADIAASFQHTIVTSLVTKTRLAAAKYAVKEVILGGGVAANTLLRERLASELRPLTVRIPDLKFTTDNAAVIASAAHYHNHPINPLEVQANPSLELS